MGNYLIKLNSRRCIHCKACEVQCQVYHHLPAEIKLGVLMTGSPRQASEKPEIVSAYLPCFHCEQPWCVAVCPTGAMVKRPEDGIVYVDKKRCVGCKACIMVCPWQVPQWNEATGKIMKCDYCRDRLETGLKPACVTACTTHALSFGKAEDDSRKIREAYAKAICVEKEWVVTQE